MNEMEVPEGWNSNKINELCEVVRGGSPRPKGDPRYFDGPIPWIKISDVSKSKGKYITETREGLKEEGISKSRFLKSGSLILTNSATICLPKIMKIDGCIHDGFLSFLDLNKNIDLNFLYYFFLAKRQFITDHIARGLAQKNLNVELVGNITFSYPSLKIQKLIIQKLDHILKQFEEKKKQLIYLIEQNKDRIKFFEKNWIPYVIDQEIEKHPKRMNWGLGTLGETFHESNEKWKPSQKSKIVNYVGLENIESNTGVLLNFTPTENFKIKSSKTIFNKSAVLYGKLRPYLNKVFLPEFDGICSTDILVLKPKSNIDREFLAYFLRSWHVLSLVDKSVHGTKMPRTKIQVLQKIPIRLPDLHTQNQIVQKIKNSEENFKEQKIQFKNIKQNYESRIKYINHIQSTILDSAFSGKLLN